MSVHTGARPPTRVCHRVDDRPSLAVQGCAARSACARPREGVRETSAREGGGILSTICAPEAARSEWAGTKALRYGGAGPPGWRWRAGGYGRCDRGRVHVKVFERVEALDHHGEMLRDLRTTCNMQPHTCLIHATSCMQRMAAGCDVRK